MTEEWKNYTFLNYMKMYYNYSTDAVPKYGQFLGVQLLGHAMGFEPEHLIQPEAVKHNIFVLPVGMSTMSRKDTSLNLAKKLYPFERSIPKEGSPEQLIVELSIRQECIQWLGEFTGLLKGITGAGYMARYVEVYNDLHGCPVRYMRRLRKRKGQENEFLIENCYLSLNSSVTPEMLKRYLTDEMVEGGFLARWLLVYGVPKTRSRGRLHKDVPGLQKTLRSFLDAILKMDKSDVKFVFSDDALGRYNAIEEEAYVKYKKILPFVGRYLNYVVSFADILLLSDAMGVAVEKGSNLYEFKQLKQLIQLKSLIQLDNDNRVVEKYSGEVVSNLFIDINDIKRINYLIVGTEYVDRAWDMIEPCLEYALSLVDYIEMELPVAKLMEFMKKKKGWILHSTAMQYAKLSSIQMKIAVETLVQMDRMETKRENVERIGRGPIAKTSYRWKEER